MQDKGANNQQSRWTGISLRGVGSTSRRPLRHDQQQNPKVGGQKSGKRVHRIQYPASSIEYPVSSIQYRVSSIEHPVSIIQLNQRINLFNSINSINPLTVLLWPAWTNLRGPLLSPSRSDPFFWFVEPRQLLHLPIPVRPDPGP